ncbi:MAG TPA: ATP-binding protein [Jatrophihabitantaceae bacterium]|nr:ATP-binding protein [Jatrophihabitantaceae bacterium]
MLRRLPVRARLTLAFALAMLALFAAAGVALYAAMSSALLDELDTGLRSRAATLVDDLATDQNFRIGSPLRSLLEPTETVVQVLAPDGSVLETSPGVSGAVLTPAQVRHITGPHFFERDVAGIVGRTRILALPARKGSTPVVAVVGGSMSDRVDAMNRLTAFIVVGGTGGVLVTSVIGWFLAGAALGPVERMRRQASAITASGVDRRLSVPQTKDEIQRLATTLNDMLARLDEAMRHERQLVDNASHELRTPLAALRAELDLALSRPRSPDELLAALRSASEEADRLSRLADRMLVLSRASQGRLPILRGPTSLRSLLDASARLFRGTAETNGVRIEVDAPEATVDLDESRVRQAVDNLLDNALRFAPPNSVVRISATKSSEEIRIAVADSGPGFAAEIRDRALDPFVQDGQRADRHDGAGLGLAIVKTIAEAHGGTAAIGVTEGGGATVTLTVR